MGRAGAFSANFDPDNLDSFRTFCAARGEKYTKVLEQLALAYIESDGAVLTGAYVPSSTRIQKHTSTTQPAGVIDEDLNRRLNRLEENDEFNAETFETIFKRLESVEKITNSGRFKK